ncbi:MAG: hypothetical protein Tsb0019_21980 [Roseibium sp.]
MSDAKIAALEMKIAELEGQVRGVNPSVLDKIGTLAAFSSGSCTNTCTAACTAGCTKGCTGNCATPESLPEAQTPQVRFSAEANEGIELFNRLARGG